MKILTFTSLYPNAVNPRNGIFVEQRLRHLVKDSDVEAKVVAPVPWFPIKGQRYGKYGQYAKVPKQEVRFNLDIVHPRYPVVPKVGMTITPFLMAWSMRPVIRKIIKSGFDFDLIDAHYFYPDGVAATMLGKWFNKPVCITARGTDINVIPNFTMPRKLILWAAKYCASMITVCDALKNSIVSLGVPAEKIHTLRNGVDLELFKPVEANEARNKLNISGTTLLSVGNLIELKGHHLIIEALRDLPNVNLIIAGDGEWDSRLKQLASSLGVNERVRFVGTLPQDELKYYYSAVDALILASSREGMANVLLESIACGNPAIANNCGGAPEVITVPEAGLLIEERSSEAIANAVKKLLTNRPDRSATRNYATKFGWKETSLGQFELFKKITG